MTLTEAAYWFKRFGVIIAVVVAVIFVTILIVFYAPKDSAPPEYLNANCSCTTNKEDFLSQELTIDSLELGSGSELVFQVETTTGQIDSLPKIINVYEFDNRGQSLSSQLQATEIASDLGFNPEGIIRKDENTYIWLDTSRHRTLEIDARTLNFTLTTDADYIREISSKESIPSDSEAISLATNALRQANLLDSDYTNNISLKELYDIDINPDGSYSEAASSGEADLVRVDFKRRKSMISIRDNVENADQIVSSLEKKMINSDYIFTKSEEKILYNDEKVTLYNWPIKEYPCGTYELLSPSEAIQKIQDGEGSLVYLVSKDDKDRVLPYQVKTVKKFIIYEITIAYYEPEEETEFLQPIYVITGDAYLENDERADFIYYVPAINYDVVTDAIESNDTINENTTDTITD